MMLRNDAEQEAADWLHPLMTSHGCGTFWKTEPKLGQRFKAFLNNKWTNKCLSPPVYCKE